MFLSTFDPHFIRGFRSSFRGSFSILLNRTERERGRVFATAASLTDVAACCSSLNQRATKSRQHEVDRLLNWFLSIIQSLPLFPYSMLCLLRVFVTEVLRPLIVMSSAEKLHFISFRRSLCIASADLLHPFMRICWLCCVKVVWTSLRSVAAVLGAKARPKQQSMCPACLFRYRVRLEHGPDRLLIFGIRWANTAQCIADAWMNAAFVMTALVSKFSAEVMSAPNLLILNLNALSRTNYFPVASSSAVPFSALPQWAESSCNSLG